MIAMPSCVKTCTKCRESKSLSEFGKSRAYQGRERVWHHGQCKACEREYQKRYRKNPEKRQLASANMAAWNARNVRRVHSRCLKRIYGISIEFYEEILRKQSGRCAICAAEFSASKKPHVDHDHNTGAIRGLLCRGCNAGIGMLGENTASLRSAIAYLEQHSVGQDVAHNRKAFPRAVS